MTSDDRLQHEVREAALSGGRPRMSPRTVIEASWRRMRARGLDPGSTATVAPLTDTELETRRTHSGLTPLLPRLLAALEPTVDAGGQLMVVTDSEGRVLWRKGQPGVRRLADRLGFVGGSAWTEGNVGTNAIGTCLVLGTPVHIHGPEHYVESHTRWSCAAAPLLDPWTGRTIGVVDVSGPSRTMHPSALALVDLAARVASLEVRNEHLNRLEHLRAHAAPLVARVGGQALVVDQAGHVAVVSGMTAPDQLTLPADMSAGNVWLATLGAATAEPLPGGWLLRLNQDDNAADELPSLLELDLTRAPPELRVSGSSGSWTYVLTPRHAEIMVALLSSPRGLSAAELAEALFADSTRAVTVRAEMSRLRRILGPVLRGQPYRVAESLQTRLVLPDNPQSILPGSSAPVLAVLRDASLLGGAE